MNTPPTEHPFITELRRRRREASVRIAKARSTDEQVRANHSAHVYAEIIKLYNQMSHHADTCCCNDCTPWDGEDTPPDE